MKGVQLVIEGEVLKEFQWYAKYKIDAKLRDEATKLENPDCGKNLEVLQRMLEHEGHLGSLFTMLLHCKGFPLEGDKVILELSAKREKKK